MATFLIKNTNTYQEVLQVECVVEAQNRQRRYRYEKRLFSANAFKTLNIKDSYELKSLEDILVIEEQCKKELLSLVKECRDKKAANHRAQTQNYVLRVNGKEVLNMKQDLEDLWKWSDAKLEDRVNRIQFRIMGNGKTHDHMLGSGYLI